MAANARIFLEILGLDNFSKRLSKVAPGITKIAKAGVLLKGALTTAEGGLLLFVNKVTAAQDRMAKFSSRIGTTTEQLSALEYAGERSGIGIQAVDLAVQRMTRRVAEAAQGMGEAQGALKELGLDAKEFTKLPLNEQMATLADRMQGVKNQADLVRVAFKLFDSEGVGMVQMLQNGSESMRELYADAERLGIVLSTQAGKNAEVFQDQMTRMQMAVRGLSYAFVEDLGPAMSGWLENSANALADNREAIVSFVKSSVLNIGTFVNVLGQLATHFGDVFTLNAETLKGAATNIWEFVTSGVKAFGLFGAKIAGIVIESFRAVGKTISDFGAWAYRALLDLASGSEIESFSATMSKAVTDNFEAAADTIRRQGKVFAPIMATVAADAGKAFAASYGVNLEQARADAQASYDAMVAAGTASMDELTDKAGEVGTGLSEGIKKGTSDAKDELKTQYEQLVSSLEGQRQALLRHYMESVALAQEAARKGIATQEEAQTVQIGLAKDFQKQLTQVQLEEMALRNETGLAMYDEFYLQIQERARTFLEGVGSVAAELSDTMFSVFERFSTGFGDAIAGALVEGKSAVQALKALGKEMLSFMISTLIKIGIQRLVLSKISQGAASGQSATEMSGALAGVYANSFKSAAAIPVYGWKIAPFVAAANLATAAAGSTAAKATGAGIGVLGQFDAGIDSVPQSGTYVLKAGERVIPPEQNKELTKLLDSFKKAAANTGGSITKLLTVIVGGAGLVAPAAAAPAPSPPTTITVELPPGAPGMAGAAQAMATGIPGAPGAPGMAGAAQAVATGLPGAPGAPGAPGMAGAAQAMATGAAGAGGDIINTLIDTGKQITRIYGQFDTGMDYVPRAGTYLLNEGERVIPPAQNKDLTEYLATGGGNITIDQINITVLPNATNAEAVLDMTAEDWRQALAGPIYDAMDALALRGVKPEFAR